MKASKIVVVLSMVAFLAACAENQNSQKQTLGTIIGAGLGALAGSQIGSGKGKLAAVAIGALGGAFAGGQLGKSLDDVDRMKAGQTQQTTLENNKDGVSSTWNNPNTGHSGRVTPTNTERVASSGEYCREYEHEITVDGRKEIVKGTACRQPNGSWRVIN
ncbi:MAG: glycine zipper 2TM domain-containing protein [Rhodospirillaceae bacterium]|jgi:surface antigen|nr:glycine zipper 2TM domain-containing protein [Rhodospirillaceae bacterium]MBT4590367.1 glycine zipper 2TM domain-containing protein [Rhodospirillaceae bacterium]MBT4939097.1 glycine zipper 2TM domain-containing protein [Rhodospirillaceae bacterium]MBT7266499.1 glycine zipper 2TM domain-containing protein [Rhodospirillaceae bacterium]